MGKKTDPRDALLEAGLALTSELSLDRVLQRIVELASELTRARYGALGVLGPDGQIIEFVTTGITASQKAAIGHPPEGRGILGALVAEGRPLRLARISDDPRSVGFPARHPNMESFLGAPIKALGRVFGNIYLTDKQGADAFSEEDEQTLVILATQAGVAVANANLYEDVVLRERRLDAAREITTAILEGTETGESLALVAKRAHELIGADLATIAVPDPDGSKITLQEADGLRADELRGARFPLDESISGEVIRTLKPVLLEDASRDPHAHQPVVRLGEIGPAMFVPLIAQSHALGTLLVANRRGGRAFHTRDLELVESFAQQAAIALEYGRAQQELRRLALMEERERIAKELHDGVIQSLFAVGMGLQGTALLAGDDELTRRIEGAVEDLDRVIRDLRNYIFGLRPGILADRQLDQALRELVRGFEERSGVVTVAEVDPDVAAELSSRAGDLVQLTREALSNVGRHAHAETVRVSLRRVDGCASLEIDDDGDGFDVERTDGSGNGLRNIRERTQALGGELHLSSAKGEGTTLRVVVPI